MSTISARPARARKPPDSSGGPCPRVRRDLHRARRGINLVGQGHPAAVAPRAAGTACTTGTPRTAAAAIGAA
jgi:hypothetical protein